MAGVELSLTRRALLGAAFAPVALSRHPGGSRDPGTLRCELENRRCSWVPGQARDDERWNKALARFAAAEAAIAAAAGAPDHIYDPIGARHHIALARLLRTPSPNLAALARKLDLALDERTVEFFGDAAAMKTLKQDARRLAAASG